MEVGRTGNIAEKQVRAILDAMPQCIIYLTPAGFVLHVNPKGGNLLEWPPAELTGRHISAILPDDDADGFFSGAADANGGPLLWRPQTFRTRSGRRLLVNMTLASARGETGELRFLCCAKEAADPADESRRDEANAYLFRALMENAVDPIFVKDAHGRYSVVNRAFLELTARHEDEIIGHTNTELFPGESAQHSMAADRQVLDTGKTIRAAEEFSVGGKTLRFDCTKAPVRGPNGGIIGLVGVARDITAERSLAAQLIQSQKMEAVGVLAGQISQEFGSLLASLLSNLTLAETQHERGEDAMAPIHASRVLAEDAMELSRRLLHLSNAQPAHFVTLNPVELVGDALSTVRSSLDNRVQLRSRLDKNCWTVAADPVQLRQALVHLCLNARDSLEKRYGAPDSGVGGEPWIEVVAENVVVKPNILAMESRHAKPGEYVRITVSDNGTGFPPEDVSHVFEPFYGGANARESGLALAMVYATIAQHGGWTAVESEPRLGSDFVVYLPRAAPPEESAADYRLERRTAPHCRVLVIDDDMEVRFLLERILTDHGFGALVAESGADGWEILRRESRSLDLIVLDLVMPEMSGAHFIELMREHGINIPVLICTAHLGDFALDQVRQWGVTDFIGKPFAPAVFIEKVRETLAAHGQKKSV